MSQSESSFTPTATAPTPPYDFQFAFFTLNGRLIRQHFWISYLILYAGSLVLGLIPGVNMIAGLAILWGKFAINTKRLHDMGKTGWLAAIPLGIGALSTLISLSTIGHLLGIIFSGPGGNAAPFFQGMLLNAFLLGLLNLANLGFLLWLGITPSQASANAYGPARI